MQVARTDASARPARTIGLTAAATQLALALALGGLASQAASFPNPPEPVPRSIALSVLYALPAAVGAMGALRGRGSLLGAAAASTAVGAFLAFSGVTLIFLFPALLFAIAAARADPIVPDAKWSVAPLVLFVGLAIPLTFVAIVTWGIYAMVVLALLVFVVQFGRAGVGQPATDRIRGLVLGLVVTGLMVGAGVVLFANTETRCWTFHATDAGIVYREVPVTDTFTGGSGDQIGGGCNGGVLTPSGTAMASVLGLGAVVVAAWASRGQR